MINCEDGKEVVLMAIPLFHVYGMVAGMCFAMRAARVDGDGPQPARSQRRAGQHPEV